MKNQVISQRYIGIKNSLRASAASACWVRVIPSLTPRIDINGVAIVRIQYQFIQGGIIRLMHWGKIICHSICLRVKPRLCADSHCPVGIEFIAPLTISDRLAITRYIVSCTPDFHCVWK